MEKSALSMRAHRKSWGAFGRVSGAFCCDAVADCHDATIGLRGAVLVLNSNHPEGKLPKPHSQHVRARISIKGRARPQTFEDRWGP